jgi:hypothetical protein
MTSKIKLKNLDARHNGYRDFTHFTQYTSLTRNLFVTHRAWCVEKFGMSKELHEWMYGKIDTNSPCQNPDWCWLSNESQGNRRIYFASEKAASFFALCCL